jgi:drug/metabolite transporter (DMT)-like permease
MTSNHTLKGIALMLSAMALMPFMDLGAKMLGEQGVPVTQVVWGRMFFSAVLILPFALKMMGPGICIPQPLPLHALRAVLLITATLSFFSALNYLPIADTLAIFFVQPLLITLLSPWLLHERVSTERWAAVLVGFIGTLIIVRPGFQAINAGVVLALIAGLSLALYFVVTRKMARTTNAIATTLQTNLVGTAMMTIIAYSSWQSLTVPQWSWMALIGTTAAIGHYLIVKAYENADASLLAPLAYVEMINAVNLGWLFFGDFPDRWTFAGVAVLAGCAIYVSWRERQLQKTAFT